MKVRSLLVFASLLPGLTAACSAQVNARVEGANVAVVRALETHDIVMFGEIHGNKQEYAWLRSLVGTPEFADQVDDIVVEFGNSLYQKSVDRYVSGEDVPMEQVQKAWRNLVGAVGPPSPVYASLYEAVRETNLKRKGKHQMRIVCGDPYIDWEKVKDREDIAPYLGNREAWYTQVVKDEVLAKHHHGMLIMGSGHFLRRAPGGRSGPGSIEQQLNSAGAKTFLVVFGTNVIGSYDDLDPRFDSWRAPAIVSLVDTWVGDLAAMPVITGGMQVSARPSPPAPGAVATAPAPLKLKDAADALLYLGPRDSLTALRMPRVELDGTAYGKEMARRLEIEGIPMNFLFDMDEVPQFPRPEPASGTMAHPLPPPPKNMNAPLPPRPPSQ